jgi:Zn-finger nucleic acid-binding protein
METLTCPKCQGSMRTYERSSITVDQCTECRGIFLDRGELERLVDAEVAFNAPAPQQARYEEKRYEEKRYGDRRPDDRRYEERKYDDRKHDDRKHDGDRRYDDRGNQQYPRKKKKSFFEELFD